MKKFIAFLFVLPLLLCCDKDDDNASLPPATQTGEGTFGCTVNGKNFVHNNGEINCYYQYVDGGYYFSIGGKNRDSNPRLIILATENKTISEDETLQLLAPDPGNGWGAAMFNISTGTEAYTDFEYTGELTITKFDYFNRIVSGTFWFDVQHPGTGERIEIRDGRFDSHF